MHLNTTTTSGFIQSLKQWLASGLDWIMSAPGEADYIIISLLFFPFSSDTVTNYLTTGVLLVLKYYNDPCFTELFPSYVHIQKMPHSKHLILYQDALIEFILKHDINLSLHLPHILLPSETLWAIRKLHSNRFHNEIVWQRFWSQLTQFGYSISLTDRYI